MYLTVSPRVVVLALRTYGVSFTAFGDGFNRGCGVPKRIMSCTTTQNLRVLQLEHGVTFHPAVPMYVFMDAAFATSNVNTVRRTFPVTILCLYVQNGEFSRLATS